MPQTLTSLNSLASTTGFAASIDAPLKSGARYVGPTGQTVQVLGEIEDAVTFRAPGKNMQMLPKTLFLCQFKPAPLGGA